MIILNFSHSLTKEQLEQIEEIVKRKIEQVIPVKVQFNHQESFIEQMQKMLEGFNLDQNLLEGGFLVNLPSFNVISALLLAEIHGRMGYFPGIIRIRPVEGAIPPKFEVAELINLQQIRETARITR